MYKWDYKKEKRPKFITVRWEDHHDSTEWHYEVDPKDFEPHIAESRGFRIYEDNKILALARDIGTKPQDGSYGAVGKIVKSCIVYRSDNGK